MVTIQSSDIEDFSKVTIQLYFLHILHSLVTIKTTSSPKVVPTYTSNISLAYSRLSVLEHYSMKQKNVNLIHELHAFL